VAGCLPAEVSNLKSGMSVLVAFFGLFMGTLGLLGMARPERLTSFARSWQTPTGLYVAAALWLSAFYCSMRWPHKRRKRGLDIEMKMMQEQMKRLGAS